MQQSSIPIIGFCAYSGTGKTTLLVELLPQLRAKGLKVGVIKHAHHNFEIDYPTKDSYRLRHAGASQMLIASCRRMALIEEFEDQHLEPTLDELLPTLKSDQLDLILVEGFKSAEIPKIELHRQALGNPPIYPDDPNVIAVATDSKIERPASDLPILDLNNVDRIAQFIFDYISQENVVYATFKVST